MDKAQFPFPRPGEPRISTGVAGLDEVLCGGLTPDRLYLLEGSPGAGKTTLSLQFLLAGAAEGKSGLYVTLSETADELRAAAASHGWSLDGIEIYELIGESGFDPDAEQTILHPFDLELGETVKEVIAHVERVTPSRVVFDSLSELRLLAQNPLRYRRQILALKQFFARRACTVLMLDDRTSEAGDLQLHSIAHGVVALEQDRRDYGSERRRLRVVKMRGIKFRGGFHDLVLDTGGVQVFPRLVAAEHSARFDAMPRSTGSEELDRLLGGGLVPGTNTLLLGPSGAGKTTTCVACLTAALERGENVAYYLFDEGLATVLARSAKMGFNLGPYVEAGHLAFTQVDPAELSPGELSSKVRIAVEQNGASVVVIDSLNAYMHAMPGEDFLILQMHELLTYLNRQGVTTLLVLGQHGVIGEVRSDVDLSYLSDCILLFRFFEAKGEIRTAVSVVKGRVNAHERTIRELRFSSRGLEVGESLDDFEGVLTGLPAYGGRVAMLPGETAGTDAPT